MVKPDAIGMAVPELENDQVIYADIFTVPLNNSPGTLATAGFTTGVQQLCYPLGIYSVDDGVTWNDIGDSSSKITNQTLVPSMAVSASCDNTGQLSFLHRQNSSIGGSTFNLTIAFVLLLSNTPQSFEESKFFSPRVVSYTAAAAYDKIYKKDSVNADGTTHTIAHPLNKVPIVRAWQRTATTAALFSNRNATFGVKADASNVYLLTPNIAGSSIDYRIYY